MEKNEFIKKRDVVLSEMVRFHFALNNPEALVCLLKSMCDDMAGFVDTYYLGLTIGYEIANQIKSEVEKI